MVKYTQTLKIRPLFPRKCHFSENLRLALPRLRITLSSMHIRAKYALRVIFEILGHPEGLRSFAALAGKFWKIIIIFRVLRAFPAHFW